MTDMIDLKNSSLFIIDMQNDFVYNENSPVYIASGVKIIKSINSLRIFFIKKKLPVFHIITEHSKNLLFCGRKDRVLERHYCVKNTCGAEIINELAVKNDNEIIIKKKLYSGFHSTSLKKKLCDLKIKKIFFTGLTTGCCVSSTAREAYNYDFDLYFIKECLTASSQKTHLSELSFFQKSIGTVLSIKNIIPEKS